MVSEYARQRQINIERNRQLLIECGLDKPFLEPKEQRRPVPSKKRKPEPDSERDHEVSPQPSKVQRVQSNEVPGSGIRRSSRNAGKTVDYKSEKSHDPLIPLIASVKRKFTGNGGPLGREDGPRRHNPKTYGSIPGIEVGTWWETRQGCSADAVHAPWVGGISGGPQGAYSVALSGGYDDDVDLGYAFTYTGSGGRDLKGTKTAPKNLRTAPQSSDQTFENNFNRMLQISSETKKPVRVIRGYKLKSRYAPSEGYRYDGLYTVEKAWLEKGLNAKGYLVCKFAFKRLPNQPALQVRDIEEDSSANGTFKDSDNEE